MTKAILLCFMLFLSIPPRTLVADVHVDKGFPWEKYKNSETTESMNETNASGILAIAKYAGMCGILDSQMRFQKETAMPGGEEFLERFWIMESARQGLSIIELAEKCNQSVGMYNIMFSVFQEKPPSNKDENDPLGIR